MLDYFISNVVVQLNEVIPDQKLDWLMQGSALFTSQGMI